MIVRQTLVRAATLKKNTNFDSVLSQQKKANNSFPESIVYLDRPNILNGILHVGSRGSVKKQTPKLESCNIALLPAKVIIGLASLVLPRVINYLKYHPTWKLHDIKRGKFSTKSIVLMKRT